MMLRRLHTAMGTTTTTTTRAVTATITVAAMVDTAGSTTVGGAARAATLGETTLGGLMAGRLSGSHLSPRVGPGGQQVIGFGQCQGIWVFASVNEDMSSCSVCCIHQAVWDLSNST